MQLVPQTVLKFKRLVERDAYFIFFLQILIVQNRRVITLCKRALYHGYTSERVRRLGDCLSSSIGQGRSWAVAAIFHGRLPD